MIKLLKDKIRIYHTIFFPIHDNILKMNRIKILIKRNLFNNNLKMNKKLKLKNSK